MKQGKIMMAAAIAAMSALGGQAAPAGKGKQPNLLVIHTDEHNFRTLGCYRDLMTEDQAFIWGKGVKVDTPHIDSLARDGAICTSYYAASACCTPSRASFISGLYPVHTGSPVNDMPLNDGLITFAEVLKRQGYATSYVGKWHLDGHDKPGFAPARKFGFDDNRYMINRGHWKMLRKEGNTANFIGKFNPSKNQYKFDISEADEKSFTTDFLVDRTLEIIERDKGGPFCVMLSIPDPHGPNHVRAPYDTMFDDMHFQNPRTMDAMKNMKIPGWVSIKGKNSADKGLMQKQMQWYFGMVKCIDDNIGRMLAYLENEGLADNTIVVFTSDHGDLMGEHMKHNKGLAYEGSNRIPFVIRYPEKIPAGKVIRAAYTTVDSAPTILGMMGAPQIPGSQGTDASAVFQSSDKEVVDDRIVYLTDAYGRWTGAVNNRYKLVLSRMDDPWLFDLKKDPDELINFYTNPEYAPIAQKMQAELLKQMKTYQEPALEEGGLILETGGRGSAESAEEKLSTSEGYLVDSGGHSAKGEPGKWVRALTVPESTFEPNSSYELEMEWESGGLDEEADFYANFMDGKKDKKNRQLESWKGAAGESGVVRKTLKTSNAPDWTLIVGIRGGGELRVKRIRIKKLGKG